MHHRCAGARVRGCAGATEVSADFIGTVTEAVTTEIAAWQARPLAPVYPVIFVDALRVKMRDERTVRNKAVYSGAGAC